MQNGIAYEYGEIKKYDGEFPYHPLSQVRSLLDQIEKGFTWDKSLEKLSPFKD